MPTLTLFCGVNGSGKTTLYQHYKTNDEVEERVNTDEILQSFAGKWDDAASNLKAAVIALKKLKKCLEKKISFNWETTIITPYNLKFLEIAKERGFKIDLYFVAVDSVDIALDRINQRVGKGGHGIDEKSVLYRFNNQFKHMPETLMLVDHAALFDNTEEFKKVAELEKGTLVFYDSKTKWLDNIFDAKTQHKQKENRVR